MRSCVWLSSGKIRELLKRIRTMGQLRGKFKRLQIALGVEPKCITEVPIFDFKTRLNSMFYMVKS